MKADGQPTGNGGSQDGHSTAEAEYTVGYKRPPKEHQFQKGQKPPPRKQQPSRGSNSPLQVLERLLAERRRAKLDGRVAWLTTGEILVRKAHELAEQSPTIRRLLVDIQFRGELGGEREPQVVCGSPALLRE